MIVALVAVLAVAVGWCIGHRTGRRHRFTAVLAEITRHYDDQDAA
ncbi:hypothetical protein [Streptomyces sp. NPDC088812]